MAWDSFLFYFLYETTVKYLESLELAPRLRPIFCCEAVGGTPDRPHGRYMKLLQKFFGYLCPAYFICDPEPFNLRVEHLFY